MSPVTGLARLLGRILWWVYMENLSPVDRDEFKKYNQNGTLAPEVCLDFSPYESCEPRSGVKEKPLVTLDVNLTFMQPPGSGYDPRARIG